MNKNFTFRFNVKGLHPQLMPPGSLTQIAYCNDSKAELVRTTTGSVTFVVKTYKLIKKTFGFIITKLLEINLLINTSCLNFSLLVWVQEHTK